MTDEAASPHSPGHGRAGELAGLLALALGAVPAAAAATQRAPALEPVPVPVQGAVAKGAAVLHAQTAPDAASLAPPGIAPGASVLHPLADGLLLRVEVPADEPAEGGSVDLILFEEAAGGLIMSRLTTRRIGQLRNSWRTDLNDDDNPEFVLAFASARSASGARSPDTLQVWEWRAEAHAFVRIDLPPLETESAIVERRLAVTEAHLDWQVVLEDAVGKREEATYRLDTDAARWQRRRGWLPW